MDALDSTAVFQERLAELKLGDLAEKFNENGWDTIANFAFSVPTTGGSADNELFMSRIVTTIAGEGSPRETALRRLFYECYTIAASDMRRRL